MRRRDPTAGSVPFGQRRTRSQIFVDFLPSLRRFGPCADRAGSVARLGFPCRTALLRRARFRSVGAYRRLDPVRAQPSRRPSSVVTGSDRLPRRAIRRRARARSNLSVGRAPRRAVPSPQHALCRPPALPRHRRPALPALVQPSSRTRCRSTHRSTVMERCHNQSRTVDRDRNSRGRRIRLYRHTGRIFAPQKCFDGGTCDDPPPIRSLQAIRCSATVWSSAVRKRRRVRRMARTEGWHWRGAERRGTNPGGPHGPLSVLRNKPGGLGTTQDRAMAHVLARGSG